MLEVGARFTVSDEEVVREEGVSILSKTRWVLPNVGCANRSREADVVRHVHPEVGRREPVAAQERDIAWIRLRSAERLEMFA